MGLLYGMELLQKHVRTMILDVWLEFKFLNIFKESQKI